MSTKVKSRIGPTILLVVLFLFASLIVYATIGSIVLAVRQLAWTKLSCEIKSSEVKRHQDAATEMVVEYSFPFKGATKSARQFKVPSSVVISDKEFDDAAQRLQVGTFAPCWIDSSDPPISVLQRESLSVAIVLIFPLILFPISIVGLKFLWFPPKPKVDSVLPGQKKGRGCGATLGFFGFFGLFIAVGLILTYVFFLSPYLAFRRMQSWKEAKCTIISSEVRAHTSKDSDGKSSTSYSLDFKYKYEDGGRSYVGDIYNPAYSTLSNYSSASAIDDQFPVDATVPCYLNPEDSLESALARDFPSKGWLGLFPIIFSVAGLLGLFHVLGSVRNDAPSGPGAPRKTSRRAQSRLGGFIGLIGVTVVWNGIVAAAGFGLGQEWMSGKGSIFPLLIVTPFALIGMLLLISIPYAFLQIFNPVLDLDLQTPEVEPGGSFTVGWKLQGNPRRIRKLEIFLELHSIAIANTTTAKNGKRAKVPWDPVLSLPIASSEREQSYLKGSGSVRIPELEKLPPNLPGQRLEWKVRWRLSIPWYPDSSEIIPVKQSGTEIEDPDDED